jgi:PKD repeat protein
MTLLCRNLGRSLARALPIRALALGLGVFLAFAALADAQTWTPLNHQPTFVAGTALLLTDGTVMVQQMTSAGFGTENWWRLTPDSSGSYQNGTWTQLASLPTGYAPLYYASAVLPDGRVVVEGGEYIGSASADSTMGVLYNPATNTWTSIAPPSGVTQIGDAASVILANGTFMLGPCCFQTTDYLLNPSTLTWTATGAAGKADANAEENWTLLPNGNVLTIDTENGFNSELYNPSTGSWSSAGSTIVQLPLGGTINGSPFSPEMGPAVLRPNGTIFATGATSNIAVYDTASGTWSTRNPFPGTDDVADGPAALLPNGNVLVAASPGFFTTPLRFYEFDGTNLNPVAAVPNASGHTSFQGRMLVLPTGQILFTDSSSDVELYTPAGTYASSWRPTISSSPSSVVPGATSYFLSGTQLNGLSQGAMYGDDSQAATNYPLVRITNIATNHVIYARTHSHSTMGVATGSAVVSTLFDVPAGIEPGPSRLEVVANGIPSTAVSIQVAGAVNYVGTFDHAGCDTLTGWAADQSRLNTAITVSIYNNGALLTTVLASGSRPDVGALLGDNGLHGFSIATPLSLRDGSSHLISVRFESSSTELGSSPVSLTCSPPPPPPVANFSFTCTGLTCSFNGSSSTGTGLTYAWSFGDSTSGTGSTASHTYAASGVYTATLTVTDSMARPSSKSKNVSATNDPVAPAESYFAVAPCRILDTRNTTILTSNQPLVINIAGSCGIPSTAKAVSFNATAVSPNGSGKITLYPGNLTASWSGERSTLNFAPATSPRGNDAVIQLATDGTGTLGITAVVTGSPGQVHLILDVQGYFSTDTTPASGAQGPLGFQTLPICRLADTRNSSPLAAGTVRTFTAQGVCGVPAGAAVGSLQVGVIAPAYGGYFTVYPSNIATPTVSAINFPAGISALRNGARVNLAPTTPDFAVNFGSTAGASVNATFDVNGYFKSDAPLKYHPIAPCRVVDTTDPAMGGPALVTDVVRTFQVQGNCGVPVGAKAAAVRLKVSVPTSVGVLSVYPSDVPLPSNSTIQFDANEPELSMGTIVALSTLANDLAVSPNKMTAGGTVHLLIDVFGYFQ